MGPNHGLMLSQRSTTILAPRTISSWSLPQTWTSAGGGEGGVVVHGWGVRKCVRGRWRGKEVRAQAKESVC